MPRLRTRWAAALWAVILTAISLRVTLFARANSVYPVFRCGGQKWLAGEDLYSPPPPHDQPAVASGSAPWDLFRYSPAVAVGFVPWTLLPAGAGEVVWRWLNAGVFLGALGAWCRWRGDERPGLAAVLLGVMPLSIGGLNNGQGNALLAGLSLVAAVALARGRWWLAAGAVIPAVLYKGYPIALGLLFCLVEPRRFAPRLALGLIGGLALPYVFQRPEYVTAQYAGFFGGLCTDDRSNWPVDYDYRNFHMLLRVAGVRLSIREYRGVELLAGSAFAAVVLAGRRRAWGRCESVEACLGLGSVWMTLFGPATESCTYVLLAPVLARAVHDAAERPWPQQALAYGSLGLFTATAVSVWFPRWVSSPVQTSAAQPLAACLLAAYVLLECRRAMQRASGACQRSGSAQNRGVDTPRSPPFGVYLLAGAGRSASSSRTGA